MKPRVSVIIPTFNERKNISILIKKIEATFSGKSIRGEIVIVDDNSPDGTALEVGSLKKKYSNLVLEVRKTERGLGSAHRRGYDLAKGELIVSMDADLSHDPAAIPDFIGKLDAGFDVVVGSRYMAGAGSDKPFLNRFISGGGSAYTAVLLGIPLSDFTNGYRAFRKSLWNKMRSGKYSDKNTFLIEFLYGAKKAGAKITQIPASFRERRYGVSKTPLLHESLKALLLPFRLRFFG